MRSNESVAELRALILNWYRAHRRDLPWRRTRDPYAIWISEVMLQQTRVDTVVPYYERFLDRWPTVESLAAADPDDVRAAWSGLGYYRRAQTMLKAAHVISERGVFPSDADTLGELPGFGPYTRGAVASIAFDRPVAAVDGNVSRVLSRIDAIEGDVTKGASLRAVWALASRLAPGDAPGELNQGLIELGALVCKRNPLCGSCPVHKQCRAREAGRTDEIPPPRKRTPPKEEDWTTLVLHDRAQVVLSKQPAGARFAELWTPPLLPGALSAEDATRVARAEGLAVGKLTPAGRLTHLLSHRRMELTVWVGALPSRQPSGFLTADLTRLNELGLPSIAAKILRQGLPQSVVPHNLPGRAQSTASQARLPLEPETR